MKSNQKGFSVVEILLVVVVVGLIGAVSWLVYDRQKSDVVSETPVANTQANQQDYPEETPENETETSNSSVKQGYKLFDDTNLSLQHPDTWTSYKVNDQPEWIFFKSPDYEPATELGPSVKAGQWLEVRVAKSESYESYENDLKNAPTAQENHGGTYETIKIDSNNAVLSDTKTHGTYWYATTYKNEKTYYFRLNVLDEDKPDVKELFKTILATVDIK